jgi:hypothetical protein
MDKFCLPRSAKNPESVAEPLPTSPASLTEIRETKNITSSERRLTDKSIHSIAQSTASSRTDTTNGAFKEGEAFTRPVMPQQLGKRSGMKFALLVSDIVLCLAPLSFLILAGITGQLSGHQISDFGQRVSEWSLLVCLIDLYA